MRFFDRGRRATRRAARQGAVNGPPKASLDDQLQALTAELRLMRSELDFVRNRLNCYLGDGVALTYLADETPLLINSNDVGAPFNLLNGGRYEEDNTAVLLSFVRADTVFLDIGANVGFYTIKIGRRLGHRGKVYAFEPHPKLHDLLCRNIYVNGLVPKAQCFQLALSECDGISTLQYPHGHLGGGHMDRSGEIAGHIAVDAETRRLDDLLGPEFRCDLVKIDVEGHELGVLNGMRSIIDNSPQIKILFEKLSAGAIDDQFESFFGDLGFELYAVGADASLSPIETHRLGEWRGYVLAARPGTISDGLQRARFSIDASQLWTLDQNVAIDGRLRRRGTRGDLLFHGPYWFLPRGIWRLRLNGEFSGALRIALLERFGHRVLDFTLEPGEFEHVFVAPRDLVAFECAGYADAASVAIDIERIDLIGER